MILQAVKSVKLKSEWVEKMGDSDVDKLKVMFTKQYEKELAAAKTDKSRDTINQRFQQIEDSFDSETKFQAMV